MNEEFLGGIIAGIFIGIFGLCVMARICSIFIPDNYSLKELQQIKTTVCKY